MGKAAFTGGGTAISWGAEQRRKGKLVVRMCSVASPEPLCGYDFSSIKKFILDIIRWKLLDSYHSKRVTYATKNGNKEILEKYRTGEDSPESIFGAIRANIKLICPIFRNTNTKYW